MKYPKFLTSNVIDITKPPYNADNTGKTDCTHILRQAIDDCMRGYIDSLNELRQELLALYESQGKKGNVYVGAEAGRVIDGEVYMTGPKEVPPVKILYFPNGTYLVSDTICYTFENLIAPQQPTYTCELCRNIHILGESKENTVIRLVDNAKGFEKGNAKPLICFNKHSKDGVETTNCAQMNTLEDITVDCGKGNDGVVGVLYASSNVGRMENVKIVTENGRYGIVFDYGSEGYFGDMEIVGFDYGMKTNWTSPCIFENLEVSQNKIAGAISLNGTLIFRSANFGDIPALEVEKGEHGRYYFADSTAKVVGEKTGSFVFFEKETASKNKPCPKQNRSENFDDWACIDDFGAVGDGVTDSTNAIQRSMDSGKKVIVFGSGVYLLNRTVKIPATVEVLDFSYASIIAGRSLLIGEMEGAFEICEDSEKPFFAEHFTPGEGFEGFFRMFKHACKRTVVLKDISMAASLYFNTVEGGEVYFDNVFTHTNHYTQNVGLPRVGYVPVFCRVVPVELHGQKAYGRNLNIERADVELWNDNSTLVLDGYKVEGPGVLVKSTGNANTKLNLFNAAWWGNSIEDNALFSVYGGEVDLAGGLVFCFPENDKYCVTILDRRAEEKRAYLKEVSVELDGKDALNRSWGRMIVEWKV